MKLSLLSTTCCALFAAASTQISHAAITLTSGLSTGSASDPVINKATTTVTGPSSNGAVPQNLVNGDISGSFPGAVWFNGDAAGADQTLLFDFGGSFTITSVTVDFAWADRDDMDYTFNANGSNQGSFTVANTGVGLPGEPQTTFIFDTPFTASSVNLNLTDVGAGPVANEQAPAIAEVSFNGAPIPEPSTALLGLLGLGFAGIRRRR